jgi:hypothetical protein
MSNDGFLFNDVMIRMVSRGMVLFVSLFFPALSMASSPPPHIVIFILENKGYSQIIGNSHAPFLNALAKKNMVMTNYHAMTHPSLPNYVELVAGSSGTSHSDDPSQRFAVSTVVDKLESKGFTVSGYFEGLPYAGFDGDRYPSRHPVYVQKHNPFMLIPSLRNDPKRAVFDRPLEDLDKDLKRGHLPNLSYVVPGLCHDMHGGGACKKNSTSSLIEAGDLFMSKWVPKIMASEDFRKGGVILIVWDEGRGFFHHPFLRQPFPGKGGRVPLICVTSRHKGHLEFSEYSDHRVLLNAILARFGLSSVPNGDPPSRFPGVFMEDDYPGSGTFFYPGKISTTQEKQ